MQFGIFFNHFKKSFILLLIFLSVVILFPGKVIGDDNSSKEGIDYFDFMKILVQDSVTGISSAIKKVKNLCTKSSNLDGCVEDNLQELKAVVDDMNRRFKKIHYPYWYGKDKYLAKAMNILNSDADCDDWNIAMSVMRDVDSKNQLYNKIKNKDIKCRFDVLHIVADNLNFNSFPKECLDEKNKNYLTCKDMLRYVQAIRDRFLGLVKLNYGEGNMMDKISTKVTHVCTKHEKNCINNSIQKLTVAVNDVKHNISDIAYPYWYGKDKYFAEAMNVLNSKCADCQDVNIIMSIITGSDSKYNQLYDKIKNKNTKCQIDILRRVIIMSDNFNIFSEKCLDEMNKNLPPCRYMLKHAQAIKDRFLGLVKLNYGEDILATTEAHAICVECEITPGKRLSKNLFDIKEIVHQSSDCRKLKPNEEKTIYTGIGTMTYQYNGKSYSFQSISDGFYNVKREKDGSYSIPLVLNFSPGKDYDGLVSRDKVPEHYMHKAQTCLKKANQKMLGPNGEKLKINIQAPIMQDKAKCSDEQVIDIIISSSDFRSNWRRYESDINCPTIIHEVLHLLGLHDEYEEKSIGFYVHSKTGEVIQSKQQFMPGTDYQFKPAFDCRVTQKNSIMETQKERWQNVYTHNKNKSLLDPGHFNKILYGNCEINKSYNECSQLVYKNSHDDESCLKKKSQCESHDILGRNK